MHSSTELDAATVERLRQLDLDGHLLVRLRDAFERTLERQRPALAAARTVPPDRPALQRAMHVLKSAATQLGALDLAEACHALEQAALARATDDALSDLLDRFDARLLAARAALAAW